MLESKNLWEKLMTIPKSRKQVPRIVGMMQLTALLCAQTLVHPTVVYVTFSCI